MAIGIKSTDLFPGLLKPAEARLCDVCNCVVAAEFCPLCDDATMPHPDADDEPKYCMKCADEIQPRQALVIPWTHDPYIQSEDGDLICVCAECAKKEAES